MNKNYNYQRKKLLLPEYGRHIQLMVNRLSAIEDRSDRNRQAHAVIAVMGNINPTLRDSNDFCHKLWDHLFVMSGFNLDVDSPYPIPTAATLSPRPDRMPYPQKKVRTKFYGRNVENIIRELAKSNNSAAVEEAIGNVARFMRSKSYEFNQDHPNNEVIIKDIKKMSGDAINIDEVAIGNIKSEYKSNTPSSYQKGGHKNGKSNKSIRNGGKLYRKRNEQR